MKYCPSCNWKNSDIKEKCSRCSTKLPTAFAPSCKDKMGTPPPQSNFETGSNSAYTPIIIQARSQDCTQLINQQVATIHRVAATLGWIVAIISFILVFGDYVHAIIEDIPFELVESPSILRYLLGLGLIVGTVVFVKNTLQSKESDLDVYRNYCSTESLIVDNEKVYGSTSRETVRLTYKMISNVRCRPSSGGSSVGNDIFEILSVDHRIYTFYSFTNGKELKTIIDMNIQNQR